MFVSPSPSVRVSVGICVIFALVDPRTAGGMKGQQTMGEGVHFNNNNKKKKSSWNAMSLFKTKRGGAHRGEREKERR